MRDNYEEINMIKKKYKERKWNNLRIERIITTSKGQISNKLGLHGTMLVQR